MFLTTRTARGYYDLLAEFDIQTPADGGAADAVGLANIMLENSDIPLKFKLVHFGEVRANGILRGMIYIPQEDILGTRNLSQGLLTLPECHVRRRTGVLSMWAMRWSLSIPAEHDLCVPLPVRGVLGWTDSGEVR